MFRRPDHWSFVFDLQTHGDTFDLDDLEGE